MAQRFVFFCIVIFWVTMNALLWRSEYAGRNSVGSVVPVEIVWQKILTAQDNSSLEVYHHKNKIGFCRWAAAVTEEVLPAEAASDETPEGMIRRATGYRIDFDGNVALQDFPSRLRFNLNVRFTTNRVWQEFTLNLNLRPLVWEIRSMAGEGALHLRTEDETGTGERVFKFSDLQNPQKLLQDLETPLLLPLVSSSLPLNSSIAASALGLKWEARNDWFQIAHASVRAYLLEAKILDRHSVKIFVSRAGEILRVELPDEMVLVNDQLTVL